ncbi:hypothetical protein [Georgenia sp. Z1491]|uniref:hypothetical protein n=1 Tax=Georgenia sp. Z1491 TaxID=3416707 RepID=UPI003CED6F0F
MRKSVYGLALVAFATLTGCSGDEPTDATPSGEASESSPASTQQETPSTDSTSQSVDARDQVYRWEESPAETDPEPTSEPEPTPSASPQVEAQSYGSLVDLRDAAVGAGYDCATWEQTNHMPMAAQSGSCSTEDVFSIYINADEANAQVETSREVFAEVGQFEWLVGANWIINAPSDSLEMLREAIGGVVVVHEGSEQ